MIRNIIYLEYYDKKKHRFIKRKWYQVRDAKGRWKGRQLYKRCSQQDQKRSSKAERDKKARRK